ncbi:hypothetical protein O163_12005 [Caldanaerobacter subterraneus subsp. yonseiensis KB-1]|uniref:Yip1 domain-containing protein n=1 Tax=Caldanaerobacter subterraneus subsp. yonseiensis KB-1 TaxID=1388761 RepID=U5CMB0_CALSX|nr:Yip1 family protein [Caldanaerobacter subterraneus]ERM91148.1 hypothetical protein O163_12005 [Caldanaerobacter subterraneus subsp. yonseiensis KB-1]
MNFFERIYGVFFQPRETMADIVRKKPVWEGIIVLIIVSLLSSVLAFKVGISGQPIQPGPGFSHAPRLNNLFFGFIVFGSIFLTPILYFIYAAIYHFLAEVLGGEMYWREEKEEGEAVVLGTAKGLYSAVCFAVLPNIFSALISPFLMKFMGGIGGVLLGITVSLGIFIWIAFLNILAMKENYKLSTGNAALVFFMPVIVGIVIAILMAIFLGSVFAGVFSEMMRSMPPIQ